MVHRDLHGSPSWALSASRPQSVEQIRDCLQAKPRVELDSGRRKARGGSLEGHFLTGATGA